jgi:hypothetical protein
LAGISSEHASITTWLTLHQLVSLISPLEFSATGHWYRGSASGSHVSDVGNVLFNNSSAKLRPTSSSHRPLTQTPSRLGINHKITIARNSYYNDRFVIATGVDLGRLTYGYNSSMAYQSIIRSTSWQICFKSSFSRSFLPSVSTI